MSAGGAGIDWVEIAIDWRDRPQKHVWCVMLYKSVCLGDCLKNLLLFLCLFEGILGGCSYV